ncbi:hypothetical protein BDW71DRAFT_179108 [Aspergillus fruticulosus]
MLPLTHIIPLTLILFIRVHHPHSPDASKKPGRPVTQFIRAPSARTKIITWSDYWAVGEQPRATFYVIPTA